MSLVGLPGVLSAAGMAELAAPSAARGDAKADPYGRIHFVLQDHLAHPFYWWPRTLLSYPVAFAAGVELSRLVLVRMDTGEPIPAQFSEAVSDAEGVRHATLHFFADLPSGARREFVLSAAAAPAPSRPLVWERREGRTIVLDSGAVQIRLPASQDVHREAPGPILQLRRGGRWFGHSTLEFAGHAVRRITARRLAAGPLFIAYELRYEIEGGGQYTARLQCEAGLEFIRFQEDMEGLPPGMRGVLTTDWSDLGVTHRQAPNHPFPLADQIRSYDDYGWERINAGWNFEPLPPADGRLPFALGIYERAPGNFRTGTFANFWNQHTDDALGIFIDHVADWHDHEYAYEVASPSLQVRYHYQDGNFSWRWPLVRGRRSTCLALYDHARDRAAMHELESCFQGVQQGGVGYSIPLTCTSHTLFLQNRYGTLDLNRVKNWVLDYPDGARCPGLVFPNAAPDPAELEHRILTSAFVCTLPVTGTRQMAGHGPIPGRSITNFSPVPSRQVAGWIEGFQSCRAAMTPPQRRRLTALMLFLAHIHADDEFMPVINMLSGHPNFLADVKAVPPGVAFLFPDHPQASLWADLWEKCVELNTRYNTRPAVKTWDSDGGRWTENLGTYVWAFLRPSLRTEFLLRQYDGVERFLSPSLVDLSDWLVHALSAPFDGESLAGFQNLLAMDQGREWGVVAPGKGPRRVHPPQGAHAEQRQAPRALWYFGHCLQHYAPLAAEHAMWAARLSDPDAEENPRADDPVDPMYQLPDNRGTNPHLRSCKFTGYGIVLRAGVETPGELSIHLQQIDQGSNYRWGRAGEGGCGILYFYAGGKSYSYTGPEDVGDRDDQDTDFCTTFGVYKNGQFHSIGMNDLVRPFYDLGLGQFAELVPRTGPTAYAAPEYVSRSVLLAGQEYFALYDRVASQALIHRLSWFVRKGDDLPAIHLLLGAFGNRETQRTDLSTAVATGVWFDGLGDSLAVVSHRKDLRAEGTPYGCRVELPGIQDLVFLCPEPVQFAEGELLFDGTSGLIRTTADKVEFTLFHGSRIGIPGLTLTTEDVDLGISGTVKAGRGAAGLYFAPKPSRISLQLSDLPESARCYIDGAVSPARRELGRLVMELPAGHHRWEVTDALPVPLPPRIERTENCAGGGRVIVERVAGATQYRLELSRDDGRSWTTVAEHSEPELNVRGLPADIKVHLRAVALNAEYRSDPGPEYPLYVTNLPPPSPDGLRVALAAGAATISWGQVLGVVEYRLYVRLRPGQEFELLYRGPLNTYCDVRPGIRPCNAKPGPTAGQEEALRVEYSVTALNANGESARSRLADTDPASWRNWDPRPGEPFRRVTSFEPGTPASASDWPWYYPS